MRSTLVSDIAIEIELFHYERLHWIEREDLSEVAEKLHQEHSDWSESFLDAGLENLRRYYSLSIVDPLNFHAVPGPLDPFWHTHILFSRDYTAFCNKVFGEFIHHQPLLETNQLMVQFVDKLYQYTWGLQSKLFRSFDHQWWPAPEPLKNICYHMALVHQGLRDHALFEKHSLKIEPKAVAKD